MGSPRVTVILATWNRAEMLGRAIESTREQTFDSGVLPLPRLVKRMGLSPAPLIVWGRWPDNR